MLLGMTPQGLIRLLHRRVRTEQPGRPRGRPTVIGESVKKRLRDCYLKHHRQWGPRTLALWAIRKGLGRFSHGAIARVIDDLRLPKPAKPKPRRYEVTRPDAMWSEDGAGFKERGRKRELLVLQDEHSRFKTNHRLVQGPAKGKDVCSYLRAAFEKYGAPLVLKHDGGAIFHLAEVRALLAEYRVMELTGPRCYPGYNGKKERSIRDIKSFERAMARDVPGSTLESRVGAAIEDLNEHRPRPVLCGCTAQEVYNRDQPTALPDRRIFALEVDATEKRLKQEAKSRKEKDCARRKAVEQAMIRYGLLKYNADLSTYFQAEIGTN
jgi:hypothetical protein